jgi:hypothetical protein
VPSETESLALCEKAIALASVGREAAIETAVALDAVYQSRAFEVSQYGGEDTFLDELGMSQSNVSKYRKIGEAIRVYGLDRQKALEAKNVESLYLAARQPTKELAEDVLDRAAHLTFKDLKKTVDGSDECEHEFAPIAMQKCGKCGRLQTC